MDDNNRTPDFRWPPRKRLFKNPSGNSHQHDPAVPVSICQIRLVVAAGHAVLSSGGYVIASGRIAVVYGTRPEIIKLGGIVRRLGSYALLVHTGQHFDTAMSADVAGHVGMPKPEIHLEVGGMSRAG